MRRNGPSALALPATVVVAGLWLAIACATGGAGSPAASTPPRTAVASPAQSTLTPARTSSAPESLAQHSAAPETMSASLSPDQPPPGSLSATGGQPTVGLLGSYCWNTDVASACVDSPPFSDSGPDLPTLTLTSTQTQLHFALDGAFPFTGWSANYVDDNGNEVPLGNLESSFDPDAAGPSPATVTDAVFSAPPAADTSIVQVFVRFAAGGDSSYGWNVTVP